MTSYEIVFRNGCIVDGTGSPWRHGDVAIEDGHIVSVGADSSLDGETELDVKGAVVAPGFIDIHTHSDFTLPANRDAHSKVRQGVTLEIVGNCGTSAAPRYGAASQAVDDWFESNGLGDSITPEWESMAEYLSVLERDGISLNVGSLVGHGNVRAATVGYDDRAPTARELEEMRTLVDEALTEGAVGLSTGLFYPPGSYADTDEIVALAEVAAERDVFYATHMRNESNNLIESVEEAIEIGRQANVPVQISHHKAIGPHNWGKVRYTLRRMEFARSCDGIDVQCDQYPYVASSTSLGALLPNWAHDGGNDALLERLRDEEVRQQLSEELVTDRTSTWDGILVTNVQNPELEYVQGKTLSELAEREGEERDPAELLLDIVLTDENRTMHVNFGMNEDDVRTVMRHNLTMVGSDGSSLVPEGPLGEGVPHPRNYGTFPHVLGTYVREESVVSLEAAVQKMTSLPAARLGLDDRGILAAGMWADVTVFDPETVAQAGDFLNPAVYPDGIKHVLVNGEFVVRDGEHTGTRSGTVIRGASDESN